MPGKDYSVAWALEQIQADGQWRVVDNDTDKITYLQWTGAQPTEAEIDAAGAAYAAAMQSIVDRKSRIVSQVGQGNSLPELRDRLDDLINTLIERGIISQ